MLFTFPSRYWFTIGRQGVFSLGGWSPRIPTGFLVSRGTWDTPSSLPPFAYRVFTFCDRPFQTSSARLSKLFGSPTTPSKKQETRCQRQDSFFFSCFLLLTSCLLDGLGSSLFARRYLGNRFFFLFLRVLRCFSSPGCLLSAYVFSRG